MTRENKDFVLNKVLNVSTSHYITKTNIQFADQTWNCVRIYDPCWTGSYNGQNSFDSIVLKASKLIDTNGINVLDFAVYQPTRSAKKTVICTPLYMHTALETDMINL